MIRDLAARGFEGADESLIERRALLAGTREPQLVGLPNVRLAGEYALKPETLDFHGTVLMDAKVSQTQTGIKSLLLKVVDPLFRRDGRTVVPITISGA